MIRDGQPNDVSAIAHVHVLAWRETYPGIMPREVLDGLDEGQRAAQWERWFAAGRAVRQSLAVCELSGEVVGFASGAVPEGGKEAELFTLYLLGKAQGAGLGQALFAHVAGRLADLGARSLILWMAEGNPTGGFYLHLGGTVIEAKDKPFGPYMIRELCYRWDDISTLR